MDTPQRPRPCLRPPLYLLRDFEDDVAAQDWINEQAAEGYGLISCSVAGVSSSDTHSHCRVIVPAIVVAMEYRGAA